MDYSYKSLVLKQRDTADAPSFCLFAAPASEVLAWADIVRLKPENSKAVQRETKKSRVKAITKYFDVTSNTIPTAVVLAIEASQLEQVAGAHQACGNELVSLQCLKITTADNDPQAKKPALVIDGQHRLQGMSAANPAMLVNVVGILGVDDLEKAFQFLVINNKAAKVPRDHISALALNYSKEGLEGRLKSARLSLNENYPSVGVVDTDDQSPFKSRIAWPNNAEADRWIVPAAIESSIAYIRSKSQLAEPEDADAFFISMWSAIKEVWDNLWYKPTAEAPNHLLEKVSIVCLNEFVTDTLIKWSRLKELDFDLSDDDQVRERTKAALSALEPKFWKAEWKSASYDTKAGRDQILEALETIADNREADEPWHKDVKILDTGWVSANA